MNNDENFGRIYDGMNNSYSELEKLAEYFYGCIHKDPNDEMSKELFKGLTTAMQGILTTQRDLINSSCNPSIKDSLIALANEKSRNLNDALQEVINKNR